MALDLGHERVGDGSGLNTKLSSAAALSPSALNSKSSAKPSSTALLAFIQVSASMRWLSLARDRPVLIS